MDNSDTDDVEREHGVNILDQKRVAVALMDATPWNVNEMDEKTFNRLVREIKEVGFLDPVQLIPMPQPDGSTRYRIVGGEHRWRAAGVLGLTEIPASILIDPKFQDEELQKALSVRLNVLKGRINKEKMVKLFQEFAEKYATDQMQDIFAFTKKDEWEKLVKEMRKSLVKSGMPKELLAEFDKNAKTAKTVDDLSRIVQRLYEMYGDTVPYGFMVMTWGKKEHVYIAMTQKTKSALDKLMIVCREQKIEINSLLAPAIDAIVAKNKGVLPEPEDAEGQTELVTEEPQSFDPRERTKTGQPR